MVASMGRPQAELLPIEDLDSNILSFWYKALQFTNKDIGHLGKSDDISTASVGGQKCRDNTV